MDPALKLTDRINLLKAFYLIYFGEIPPSINVGSLFVQLVASTPHIYHESESELIKFSDNGTRALSKYILPPNLEDAYQRFASTTKDPEPLMNKNVQEEAPKDPIHTLVKDNFEDKPGAHVDFSRAYPAVKRMEDILAFKRAVIDAFTQILTQSEQGLTHISYRSLHLTAFFLILFLMRRITKTPEDIVSALTRTDIHKHYTDMITNPFGMTIPPPSTILNRALDQALSTRNQASRELYTIALWLLQQSTDGFCNKPLGHHEQKHVGLEAVLRATCMTHIAGAGLQLITLFVTVKSLFNKTEKATLEWLAYHSGLRNGQLISSIKKIVELRASQRRLLEQGQDIKLFPYCRLVHQRFHSSMGYKGNEVLCYLMACLIDQRCPPSLGTGGTANAFWTASMNPTLKSQIYEAAKSIYFKLTAYPGHINYNTTAPTGQGSRSHVQTEIEEDNDSETVIPIPALTRK